MFLAGTHAISSHSPQPIADIARGLPGAGRLASKAAEALTNPKDHKHKQQKHQQHHDEQAGQQQAEQEQQLQQEHVSQTAEAAALDNSDAAATGLAAGAEAAIPEATAPEAVVAVAPVQQQEVSEYTEEEIQPKTIQERYQDTVSFLTSSTVGKGISIAAGLFLGATFFIALYRTYQKYTSPRAQRKRVVSSPCAQGLASSS